MSINTNTFEMIAKSYEISPTIVDLPICCNISLSHRVASDEMSDIGMNLKVIYLVEFAVEVKPTNIILQVIKGRIIKWCCCFLLPDDVA